MSSAARWSVLAVAVIAWSAAPSAASAGRDMWSGAPDTTIDQSAGTVPEPTTPDPGTPEPTTPESSAPTEETLIAAGVPDADVDTTTAAIAIVGFILLVAVASWWMVRRTDPDAVPMPPRDGQTGPPSDLV